MIKNNDLIYTFPRNEFAVFHLKCEDDFFNKEDSYTIEDFSENINEPFELYEKYIRVIEVEKRISHITVETLIEEFPEPVDDKMIQGLFDNTVFKTFIGEYDDEMKQQIEAYIYEMGYSKKLRQESFLEHTPGFRKIPYMCNIVDIEQTLGFYFSRHGYLKDCFKESFPTEEQGLIIKGNIKDFEEIGKHFDTDYIKYLYGSKGLAHLQDYYQKHFIDNFEHGKSIVVVDSF